MKVDIEDGGINGLIVRSVTPGGTLARDGRVQPGDYLVSVHGESVRRVSHSRALDVLRRTHAVPRGQELRLTFIPASDAAVFKASEITRLSQAKGEASSSGGGAAAGDSLPQQDVASPSPPPPPSPPPTSAAAASVRAEVSEKANGTTVISIGGHRQQGEGSGHGGSEDQRNRGGGSASGFA
jgi:hypothetical protein